MSARCVSWRGHKFSPRFDTMPPTKVDFGNETDFWTPSFSPERVMSAKAEVVRALTRKTYVRDVCERCGATVERSK